MDLPKSEFLFVYSSLLRGFPTPDYKYVSQYFDFVGQARTKGKLSILDNILVGTPSDEDIYIKGELYRIREHDQFSFAIGQLDEYEGVNPEPSVEAKYRRSSCEVITEDNTIYDAWVYWYNFDVAGLPVVESGSVLDYLANRK